MKKLLTFLTLLTLFFGVGWAAEETVVFSAQGYNNQQEISSYTGENFSITFNKGSNSNTPKYYSSGSAIRLYGGNTFTVSSTSTITFISLTFDSGQSSNSISANTGNYVEGNNITETSWLGSANSIQFSVSGTSGHRRLKSLTVTTGGSTPTTYSLTLPTGLTGGIVTATGASDLSAIPSGTSITITATPNTGYELSTLTVDNTDVTSSVSNNQYTFSMPAHDVAVSATFTEQSVTPTTSTQYSLINNETDLLAAISAGKKFVIYSPDVEAASKAYNNSILPATSTGLSYDATNKILTVANNDVETYTITATETSGAYKFQQNSDNTYISVSSGNNTNIYNSNSNVYVFFYGDYAQLKGSSSFATSGANARALSIETVSGGFKNFSGPGKETPTTTQYKLPGLYAEAVTGDLTVTCADNLEHGSITASPTTANEGATITINANPDAGYELSTITVTPETGSAFQATVSGNTATFVMPASSVSVTATFVLAWNGITATCTPTTGGQVWVNPSNDAGIVVTDGVSTAQMGTSVTFKVVPADGFNISSVTATDAAGTSVNLSVGETNDSHGGWGTYYTFTMPSSAVTINAAFTEGNLFIIGTANDNTWDGNIGVQMTYDAQNKVFTKDVFFSATDYGNFSFADALSGENGSWANMGRRYGAPSNEYDLESHGWTATWDSGKQDNSFKVPAGVYTITVNKATGNITVAKKTVTVTLDKTSGQLETGTTVNVASNLSTLLQSCKNGVSATLAYSTDDGANYTDGNSFVVNSNMTAKGKAYYGTIEAESDAYDYTVVTHYPVTATANPTAGGTVSVSPASALAGETVTITASPKSGYQLESITVNGTAIEPNEGVYSFTMPAQATEVIANFSKIQYAITKAETKCTIDITEGVTITDGNITAGAGDLVKFTVTPISNKYYISSVTLVWGDGTTTTTPTLTDGVYSFFMQARPVTITAVCEREAVGDGSFVLVTDASTLKAGDKVIIMSSSTGSGYAMSTEQRTANRGATSLITITDSKVTPTSNTQIITLEGDANGWYFNVGNGYLYASSSSSNELKTQTTKDNNAKATIDISGDAAIEFQGTNSRNVLRFNNSNNPKIFSCYASSSSCNDVYIFKQTAAGLMVEIDPDGGEVIGSQEVIIDANVEGAMVQYKIGDGEWSTPADAPVTTTITGNVGDQVVVYAKATMEDEDETLEDETSSNFTFVAPVAPTITPASCNISSETQNVTITSNYDNGTIEYSTDGGTTWNAYSGQFHVIIEGVGESATVQARVTVNNVTSEVATATYTRGVQPVVFSPAGGTYYGDQTCQMFSTTKGARIYYTTDGSDPVMNQGTTKLYTNEIEMTPGNTYNFKAVAYIGTTPSAVTTADYTIKQKSEYVSNNNKLYSVAELNAVNVPLTSPYYTTDNYEMVNPVQVIYMSTYKQNGYQPEFCLIRDNTGYGMIYFGKQNSAHNNFKVFDMGDWIGGGYSGQVSNFYDPNQQVLSDTHPELGRSGSGQHIFNWVTSAMSNSAVLPEYLTISEIQSSGTDDNPDYWGHYVHLRKTTVELVQSTDPGNYTTGQDKDGKWSGTITDEDGQSIMYYDKFYLQCNEGWTLNNNLFKGHPNRTFDVYGFVACYKNVYQISPFDFAWIDKPVINKETTTYYEPQTVTISSEDDPTATIWYKTSEMDDFHVYTEPFEVNSTTTVEWYATKQSQYNDELESLRGSITMTFEEIAKPVITPESQVKAVGESVDASIAYEEGKTVSPIAVILYTTDSSDPKTSETAQEYTLGTTLTFTTTTTVRAITRVGNLYSAEADAKTYTFVKSNGIEYTLINDVTKLKENGVYVIVSQNYSEAMSTTQNVNNRGAAGVLFVEDTNKAKVYGNDDVAQFTLSVLTHDEDTSPERHFLLQTNNSNVNGYLYVGHDVNNSLMTEPEEDAMGNDVAVITIDTDGRAHIHFNYAGGDNRYLQYWNRDRLFNTYKTEYDDRAVYIYGVEATPLATIEKEGVTTEGMNQYTIADELVVVWANADEGKLWCKDQGNVSIAKTEIKDGQVDYMKEVGQQHGEWDQSNWVVLQFPKPTTSENDPIKTLLNNAVGKYIEPATVTGYYIDDKNYTIQMAQAENYTLALKEGADTTKNVYCTANFLPDNLNINGQNGAAGIYHGENRNYFFMNPKIQEVCSITFAEYAEAGSNVFIVPDNEAQISGAFTVDWSYNAYGQQTPNPGHPYRFVAAVQLPSENNNKKDLNRTPDSNIIVYPLDFKTTDSELPTAINTVETGNGEVKSIKYVNVAGMVSDVPFQGINIVVTEYTDGSRNTTKMLRK